MLTREELQIVGLSGLACAHAGFYVHPVETAMVQQQLLKKGAKLPPWPIMLGRLYRRDGLSAGPFRGLSASMLRELSFSALRVGLYEPIRDGLMRIGGSPNNDMFRIASRITGGLLAGALASALMCPMDLLKTRAQGYPTKPPPFLSLVREVGGDPFKVGRYYEGMGTVVTRAMILSSTNMAFYNEVKDFLKRVPNHSEPGKCASNVQLAVPFLHSWADSDHSKYNLPEPSFLLRTGLVFSTAFWTGFAMTCTTSPFTNARTMIMTNPGKFSGMANCLLYIVKTHGITGVYRGFGAQWSRFCPYATIQFISLEQLRYWCNINPI